MRTITKLTLLNYLNVHKVVRETYMHDFFTEGIQFSLFEKELSFSIINCYLNISYKFMFKGVQHLIIQADEKWGAPNGVIHSWQIYESNKNTPWIDASDNLIALEFLFTSGDAMLIIADAATMEESSIV